MGKMKNLRSTKCGTGKCLRDLFQLPHLTGEKSEDQENEMTFLGSSLASLSGLRIQHCHKLWCRLQTQLRSGVAVAVS